MRHPPIRIDGALAVLRTWFNDGADGESAHVLCDAVEDLRAEVVGLRAALHEAAQSLETASKWHRNEGDTWAETLHEIRQWATSRAREARRPLNGNRDE